MNSTQQTATYKVRFAYDGVIATFVMTGTRKAVGKWAHRERKYFNPNVPVSSISQSITKVEETPNVRI